MFENPFTPIFGGKPERFFGRKDVLARFETAMIDAGSEERALFVTGARGSGKTALLEQLSQRATASGRLVIDLVPDDTVHLLLRGLQRHDEEVRAVSPQIGVSLLGSGGSVSGMSSSKATHFDRADLQMLFLKACERERAGIFISIDEVQKVSEDDLSAIGGAFQMASRKGNDVMIALAGLPYAHDAIIKYDGCTYLRRAAHEELTLFAWEEVMDAFGEAFASIKGFKVRVEELEALARASYGHPYVLQLLGYYAVVVANAHADSSRHVLTGQEVAQAIPMAVDAYGRRALKPLVEEMTPLELSFVTAMASTLDERRVAHIGEIAGALGKRQRNLSAARDALIRAGIVIAVGRGELMFNIPYLAAYLAKGEGGNLAVERVRQWRL